MAGGMCQEMTVACPHFPACSGCTRIGVPYPEQLEVKLGAVRGVLAQPDLGDFGPGQLSKIHASPQTSHYRNRVKLVPRRCTSSDTANAGTAVTASTATGIGHITLGLYRVGTHEVVDIPGCPVQFEAINRAVESVRHCLEFYDVSFYDEVQHTGDLRFVSIRAARGGEELLLGLVTRDERVRRIEHLATALMEDCPNLVGVVQNANPAKGNVIFGKHNVLRAGRPYVEEEVCGLRVQLGLTSFFQVNTQVAELAYRAIMSGLELTPADVLLDLYAGVGSISLITAAAVREVVAVEEAGESFHYACAARAHNEISNVAFQEGLVEDLLPDLLRTLRYHKLAPERIALVVNPPRKGLHPRVIETLIAGATAGSAPGRMAYLSCSPPTLARDLELLTRGGYRISSIECFDMFPQTDQVETLALLQR